MSVEAEGGAEYSIDTLAQTAGTTVRNVRAYQERGLLPPPRKRGRAGVYGEAHLARLRIIGSLLQRGYSLANVAELMSAWERGHDIGEVIGLEAALTSPWSDETPAHLSMEQLAQMFGDTLTPQALARAVSAGMVQITPEGVVARSMKLLNVASHLSKEGVPLEALVDVVVQLQTQVQPVADSIVKLVVEHIFDRWGADSLPPPEEAPRLAALIWRLRPMMMQAADAEVARAMEIAAEKFLGERLSHVLEHLRSGERAAS